MEKVAFTLSYCGLREMIAIQKMTMTSNKRIPSMGNGKPKDATVIIMELHVPIVVPFVPTASTMNR